MPAPVTLVLASPADDPLMAAITAFIDVGGVLTEAVALCPSDSDAVHEAHFRTVLESVPEPFILGGFSLGARIAARLCARLSPAGLLCFGYPFHAVGAPGQRRGLDTLVAVSAPTMIVQGTRDNHGSLTDVRGYDLPESIEMVWLDDGNHRFVPRSRSDFTARAHLEAAGVAALSFVQNCRGR